MSRQNQEIKNIHKLHLAKERHAQKKFLAEGLRTITTLVQKLDPIAIYCTESFYKTKNPKLPKIRLVSDHVMEKISCTTSPPGILGVFSIPVTTQSISAPGLVLSQIQNPGNAGTLIRTAAAMNMRTIIAVETVDLWNPKTIHASAGTIAHVNIHTMSWRELLEKKGPIPLCALVARSGQSPDEIPLQKTLIVVGNEAQGIPEEWVKDCAYLCTLAMPGNTESLNAAVAGSIILYKASR